MSREYPQVRTMKSVSALRGHLEALGVADWLPIDDEVMHGPDAPLARSLGIEGFPTECSTVANRFVVLPMEGWDGTADGRPTDLVRRRWARFGESGAGMVWGGEAVAVRPEGRANPNQLVISAETVDDLDELLVHLRAAAAGANVPDRQVVGLQLTHSGRFSRPDGTPRPRTAYRHPALDDRVGADGASVLSDDELDELVGAFIGAAMLARQAGFDFVDVKHCHGYLGHELLSAVDRPGRYGGPLENRSRFLRSIIEGIHETVPGIGIGVRLSAYDFVPYTPGVDGVGEPEPVRSYTFGGTAGGPGQEGSDEVDLGEPDALVEELLSLGVRLLCVTAGSPYYNPHIQRPAYFPPSDGYLPPEDPLVGVARMVHAACALRAAHPKLVVVASGLSYLQEWLPNVAQALVRTGGVDLVGIGRMVLSYPGMPADVLAGRPLDRRRLCRTFSDCTSAPRNGLVSGCYPLDEFYKSRPERAELVRAKRLARDPLG